ncbi:cellulase family glycosylhydrolase [Sphingomonas sp. BK481]|uniref:cellulase family glycosylhydrolase n=1 Tax=Sphingomonas sp. BK481 TaxID=2586981 RepID=UPI00160BE6D8
MIDFAIAEDVAVVIDDHSYSAMGHTELLPFWTALGKKLMATYGSNDLIHLELQNETNSGGWEPSYAANSKALVQGIRAAGVPYPIILGWGGWNAVGGYTRALAELDAVGGAGKIDPLGKLEFSAHHYPTTTGNDQPSSGKSAPQIKGSAVAANFKEMFDEFKRRDLRIWITEIGMGGGARGWMTNGSGTPSFNGKAWLEQFTALVKQYSDTVSGVLAWGGGSGWADTYPLKQEYEKGNWSATKGTEFWRTIRVLWAH